MSTKKLSLVYQLTIPPVKRLDELQGHSGHDPNELIKNRFLCKGGSMVFVGQTGIGKSSLLLQMAVLWSNGEPCFGIYPARPLKTLLIQAENDEGDLAEMRDGILNGLGITKSWNSDNLFACTVDCYSGDQFIQALAKLVADKQPDLVIIDPFFAYLGGSVVDQAVVSKFLRNQLNPILHSAGCGCILVHHVNKPPSNIEKQGWNGTDFAYAGAGSAELANWARAIVYLRSIGSRWIFELMLAKRGKRVGWIDEDGTPIFTQCVCHNRSDANIYWVRATAEEIQSMRSAEKSVKQRPIPTMVEFMKLFPETFKENPAEALLTADLIKLKFVENGWNKDSYKGLCDQAQTHGTILETKGPKPNQRLRGRSKIVEEYNRRKVEEKTLLAETPLLPINLPKAPQDGCLSILQL